MEAKKNDRTNTNRHGRRYPRQTHHYPKEENFQEAWASLRFDRSNLLTTDQQVLRIFHPGKLNRDQGPDFLDADIQIGEHRHHGHVELHLDSDDWVRHRHHLDPHYDAVVLHVYLHAGKHASLRIDGSEIPGLHLGDRIGPPKALHSGAALACAGLGAQHLPEDPVAWLETAGLQRLEDKTTVFEGFLVKNNYDWAQLLWEELAAALGGPVNAACFRQLARLAPWGLVRRYTYSLPTLEALLFGVGGMLEGRGLDDYQSGLMANWQFLKGKHNLYLRAIPFKYHRMHPAGFPTVRIAQMAAIAFQFRPILELLDPDGLQRFLWGDTAYCSEYWSQRYEFGNVCTTRKSDLGADAKQRIAVNVLAPLAISYASAHYSRCSEHSMSDLLRNLAAEHNKVTRKFAPLSLRPMNSLQSQGMIGIYRGYCSHHRCLDCPIGSKVLGKSEAAG